MFHKAIDLKFKEGTVLELTFQDGKVNRYDMSVFFNKYSQFTVLCNRELSLAGKLRGYGIIWNEALGRETETILKRVKQTGVIHISGDAVGEV